MTRDVQQINREVESEALLLQQIAYEKYGLTIYYKIFYRACPKHGGQPLK